MEQEKDTQQERIQTVYSNIVRIGHTPYEFMMDFGQFQPEGKRAFMDVRIVTSPQHAKALLRALKENIANYEEKYGVINVTDSESTEEEDTDSEWDPRRR
jgi:hypothetical protein